MGVVCWIIFLALVFLEVHHSVQGTHDVKEVDAEAGNDIALIQKGTQIVSTSESLE